MVIQYDRAGIRFCYPENWTVADDEADRRRRSVLVQAPSGAFWSVDLCLQATNSRDLAAEVLQTMQREYVDLEAEAVTDKIGGLEATGYDMQFYCLDLIIAARLRTVRTPAGTLVLLCQAEDRDFQALEAVFSAMSESIFL